MLLTKLWFRLRAFNYKNTFAHLKIYTIVFRVCQEESIVVRLICQQKANLESYSHKEEDVGLQRWSDSQALVSVTMVSVN